MNKEEVDSLLEAIVQYADGISDLITEETALLYSTNKMRMVQRIDTLSLHKPRKRVNTESMTAFLRMEHETKHKSQSKYIS